MLPGNDMVRRGAVLCPFWGKLVRLATDLDALAPWARVRSSVFVVVAVVGRVAVPVVHIIDMVTMRHGNVSAVLAVLVRVRLVRSVVDGLALVIVALVGPVQASVVHVVHMVAMWHRGMATALAMLVRMVRVLNMRGRHAGLTLCIGYQTSTSGNRYPVDLSIH